MDKKEIFEDDDNMSIKELRSQITNLNNSLAYIKMKLHILEEQEKEKSENYVGKCFSYGELYDDDKLVLFIKDISDNGGLLCDSIRLDGSDVEFVKRCYTREEIDRLYYIEITLEEYNKIFDEAIEVAKKMKH